MIIGRPSKAGGTNPDSKAEEPIPFSPLRRIMCGLRLFPAEMMVARMLSASNWVS